jgi:integrase/recombinase XerD
MANNGKRPHKQPAGDPEDPKGMVALLEQFFEALRVKNFSEQTIKTRRMELRYFIDWAAARGVARPCDVSKPVVERYQRFMYHCRKRDGNPLSFRTQNGRMVALRAWFKWLSRNNHVLYNPAADLDLPRPEHRLPKHILTASQAEQVINQANVSTPLGVRDRAIMETFYSTGMRRMELVKLCPDDIDTERGTVAVRQGKGKKDRLVPVGERALTWIDRYAVEVRPGLLVGDGSDKLFLTHLGRPFTPDQMSELVSGYVTAAAIGKRGSCHLFRHTMATLMLENGADIRYIQAMLGHERLETTQIYTRVSIRKLKEVHDKTHPARKRRHDGHPPERPAS